jgi:hypothetical protein
MTQLNIDIQDQRVPVSVISLISYDASYLPESIKSYYPYVDEIVLGLDKDRISWSNNKFSFDEDSLWKKLGEIDTEDKIRIVEEDFHKSKVPIENDNAERNFLKEQCTHDWILSVDADEELLNTKEFFHKWLPIFAPYRYKVDVQMTWLLPFKEFENDILVIANPDNRWFKGDTQGVMTTKASTYTYCRWTNQTKAIMSPLVALHWSFCRTEENLAVKLQNFGHSDRTNSDPFFNNWKIANLDNYHALTNFKTSGYGSNQWSKLLKVSKSDFMGVARMEAGLAY